MKHKAQQAQTPKPYKNTNPFEIDTLEIEKKSFL